jgi:16S rRNA (uracil1498-N3)-methyltransferase
MGVPRIFIDQPLNSGERVLLREDSAHHIAQVLRKKVQDSVVLFNGRGGEFQARIESIQRTNVQVRIGAYAAVERESPLRITLVQGISRGERMDYTLQKSVELGVSAIVPVQTQRSTVRLDEERGGRRIVHWRKVLIGACEQCGRNQVPRLEPPQRLEQWLIHPQPGLKLLLAAEAKAALASLSSPQGEITLLAGPEGGFSEEEQRAAKAAGYLPLSLGPRVLRTETAALAALAALQTLWGDLADGRVTGA